MGDEICLYNQTGFCKYRQNCRKRHKNVICPEDHDFKVTGCCLRHPKVCKSYTKDSTCKFKDGCAYEHQTNKGAKMVKNLDQEVINLKLEMIHMKSVIQEMQSKIELLDEAIDNITKTNIGEIVAIAAAYLESKKDFHNANDAKKVKIAEECVDCDE